MLPILRTLLFVLAIVWVVATVLPFIRVPFWWVRMFDFPRAQIAVGALLTLLALAAYTFGPREASTWEWATFILLAGAVAYQSVKMLPYSRVWSPQTMEAAAGGSEDRRIRLVISNVLMENRDGDRWTSVVREAAPDVLAAVETDAWWAETARDLEDELPHAVEVPQDDTYGMLVRSRLPIRDYEVKHYLEDTVPSLHLTLELDSGEPVRLVVLHPRPPRPDIQQDSRLRDAELVLAGREVATFTEPTIVAGDLNDVAWSYTTTLFQKLSGLLDPRIGRGLFATFHAEHWWLRYPLDHVFHSDDLALVEIERLPSVGSDHFPMLIELAVDPSKRPLQDAPDADEDEREVAEEAVEEAEEQLQEETPAEQREREMEDQ
ncbi:MAG TPA: endonuclease [Bacteroidetes bacterium]|nr:endonuclease [Bacteroidota bacterium]HIL57105.1 endonuclease [Rhodothermales bacterium]